MLFDERRFVASFRNCSDDYCCPALVNAICATAASYMLIDSHRNNDEQTHGVLIALKARLWDEARILMKTANPEKLPSVQTNAVMFLCELASGKGLIASSHLRLACETLMVERDLECSPEAKAITFWGILSLYTQVFMVLRADHANTDIELGPDLCT